MSVYVQTNQPILLPNAAYAVNASDTGKLMIINTVTAGRTYTMPAPTAGLHYKFINMAAGAIGGTIDIDCGVGLVNGGMICCNGAAAVAVPVTANRHINFVTAATLKGDNVDLYADGTNWSVIGISGAVGGLTAT